MEKTTVSPVPVLFAVLVMPTVWAVFSFESTAFYISLYRANVVVGYKGLNSTIQEAKLWKLGQDLKVKLGKMKLT